MNEKSIRETLAIFPSSGSFFNAHESEIRFQIPSNVVSRAAIGRRIYLRGLALPAASSANPAPGIARDPLLSGGFLISGAYAAVTPAVQSYDVVLICENAARPADFECKCGPRLILGSARRVASRKLDKRKTTPPKHQLGHSRTKRDAVCHQPSGSYRPVG